MAMMKAMRIHDFGGPEVMKLEDLPVPEPRQGEILVRVHAASVNPVDYKTRAGKYPMVSRDKLPITLGRDISGVVEQRGPGVDNFKAGDEVYALLRPDRGGFAEYALLPAGDAAPKPQRLDHVEAACVPLAALTAWQGLFDHGGLQSGQLVLIHGGAGGVGHFAVQFAKARGATVFTTVAGEDIDFVRSLGATQAIDYKTQRFEEMVRNVDMVLDLISGDTQERSWSVLKPGGILVSTLGQPPQEKADQHKVRSAGYMAQPNAAELSDIGRLIDDGKVRVVVDAVYPFAQTKDAEERQEHSHVHGKIAVKLAA